MTPTAFNDLAEGRVPWLYTSGSPGLIELPRIGGLAAIVAGAVGGGSQLYTAVTIPPPEEIFRSGWPAGFGLETLALCLERVADVIRPSAIPKPLTRTLELERIGRKVGAGVTRLPLAMDWPEATGTLDKLPVEEDLWTALSRWLQGGPVCRKRTLDRTYLAAAIEAGAELRPLHEVRAIVPDSEGYRIHFRCHSNGTICEGRLLARRILLAAGAIGTVRLLFACRDDSACLPRISPALGKRFFTSGDMGALLLCDAQRVPRDSGPPVTAWMDHWEQDRLYLMEIGHPPIPAMLLKAATLLGAGSVTRAQLDSGWVFGVMGGDEVPGQLLHSGRGRLTYLRGSLSPSSYDARVVARLKELADAAGGKLIVPPDAFLSRFAVTVHPLGGAAMADDPSRGVVDGRGEVFGHPGLFIADGSILPTPIGRAPSMTIAALAEHVVHGLVESTR